MNEDNFPASLNLLINVGNVKFNCFVTENTALSSKGCVSVPHSHGDWELKFFARGRASHIVNRRTRSIAEGSLLLIQPGRTHFQTETSVHDNAVQYTFRFSLKAPTEGSTQIAKQAYEETLALLKHINVIPDADIVLPHFEAIRRELKERKVGYNEYVRSELKNLFLDFLRLSGNIPKCMFNAEKAKVESSWRQRINDFFYKQYMKDIKLQDLADELGVSRRQVSRIVLKEFGVSYVEKLTNVRIEQAKYLLSYTDTELKKISSACGFATYSYFNTCFRKCTRMTPSEYRSSYRSKRR